MNKWLLICLVSLLALSCKEVKQKVLPPADDRLDAYFVELSPYVKDQSLDFFLENSWYSYQDANHIIWPNFRVYGLRIRGEYYKFQIVDYYDNASLPGNYTVRVQKEGEAEKEIDFNAQGCGNVYTNPVYKECMRDPNRNAFTYLNLETETARLLSDVDAQKDSNWHIGFNGTAVRLNSGKYGPGDVRATNLYLYGSFFANGQIDFQRIAEESFGPRGQRFFNLGFDMRKAPFSPPPGQDRVIYESDWFSKAGDFYVARNENWWIVKGGENGAYSKFNVREISEQKVGDVIETEMTLELFNQNPGDSAFGTAETWTLPKFDSSVRVKKFCLDLHSKQIVSCGDSKADLIFAISNRSGKRRWRFNVKQGAVGPLTRVEMSKWTSGF